MPALQATLSIAWGDKDYYFPPSLDGIPVHCMVSPPLPPPQHFIWLPWPSACIFLWAFNWLISFICSNKFCLVSYVQINFFLFSLFFFFFFLSVRYHLYSWVEIGTVKVKCFVQEYNAMTQPSQSESGALRPPHLPHRPRKQHTHWIQAVGLRYLFLCGIQGFWLLALQKMIESSTSIVLTL